MIIYSLGCLDCSSVQEIEKCRIKKEAEILEIQFKLKQQYQEKKLKLLADLADVQIALQSMLFSNIVGEY